MVFATTAPADLATAVGRNVVWFTIVPFWISFDQGGYDYHSDEEERLPARLKRLTACSVASTSS